MTRRQLTPFVVAAAVLTALPVAAQVYPERIPSTRVRADQPRDRGRGDRDQGREEQTERTTRTLRIGASGELDLANISGDIVLTRGSGQDAVLEIVKIARAQSAGDAKELLGLVQVDVVERGSRAEVRTRYPDGDRMRSGNRRNVNVTVNYSIAAPANARITARSISGNVSARDLRGELTLESVSGNIAIANGGRVSSAKTISGNVEITGTQLDGALEASSVSGTVAVRRSKAQRLALSTVSGNLTLDEVDCGRVELQAVSGNLDLTGALASGGRYDLNSHSGQVRIVLTGDTGFELDATSFSGSIRSDLPLTGTTAGAERGRRQQALRGVFGNGSAVLHVTTFSGSVVISRK